MATSLADPAPATIEGAPAGAAPGAPPGPDAESAATQSAARACANCGSPMGAGQDWCLQCGAGAPGSLGAGRPLWRSGAGVLIATAILALGAAAAGYAALSKGKAKTVAVTRTVAQVTPPAAVTPGTATAPTTVPRTITPPATVKATTPLPTAAPPKIPLTATTPKLATPSTPTTTTTSPSTTTPAESKRQPILLDTNAAQTYNPYAYPASGFGDPALAIDGETATGWTAQVDPAVAPKMAEGLVVDLKSSRRIASVALVTSTPGMTVQVYGTAVPTLPASITDPAWAKLSPSLPVKSKHMQIKLKSSKPVRFLTLWISRAPASSVGTPQAPGRVSVNELELFP